MILMKFARSTSGVITTVRVDHNFQPNQSPTNPLERYDSFFSKVPVWSGKEWQTMSPQEIVTLFQQAADYIERLYAIRHDQAVAAHLAHWRIVREWNKFWGWSPPVKHSMYEILHAMIQECLTLAAWMEQNKDRPFYQDSDMSWLITKPRAVADLLGSPPGTSPAGLYLGKLMVEHPHLPGSGLGNKLRDAKFTQTEVELALLEKRFSVWTSEEPYGTVLHVSLRPMDSPADIVTAAKVPGASGEVVWPRVD